MARWDRSGWTYRGQQRANGGFPPGTVPVYDRRPFAVQAIRFGDTGPWESVDRYGMTVRLTLLEYWRSLRPRRHDPEGRDFIEVRLHSGQICRLRKKVSQ